MNMVNFNFIQHLFKNIKFNQFLDYYSVISALPKEWENDILQHQGEKQDTPRAIIAYLT